jgi:parallel beta-helix repeat protein
MKHATPTLAIAVLGLAVYAGAVAGGPINPPLGPIASTFKTLSEVEPRTIINATNTPGDANSIFRITQPGSYCLAGNVQGVASKAGIEIAASNVTIDLGGFAVLGAPASLDGIVGDGTRRAVVVRNGTISNWGGDGIDLSTCIASVVRDISSSSNSGRGFLVGLGAQVVSCATSNNGASGFESSGTSSISNCTAFGNAAGFTAASMDLITNCNATNNSGVGFSLGNGSTLRDSGASQNAHQGVIGASDCAIMQNQIRGNGGSTNAGLWIQGSYCRVEDNNLSSNGWGIYVSGQLNLIVHNRVMSSSQSNFHILNGNFLGEILMPGGIGLPIDGNSGGGVGTTDPTANYVY